MRRALCCDDSWMKQLTRHLEKNGLFCLNFSDRGEFVKAPFSEWFRLGRRFGSIYEPNVPNTGNVIAAILPQGANIELFWALIKGAPPFSGLLKTNRLRFQIRPMTRIKQKHG